MKTGERWKGKEDRLLIGFISKRESVPRGAWLIGGTWLSEQRFERREKNVCEQFCVSRARIHKDSSLLLACSSNPDARSSYGFQ